MISSFAQNDDRWLIVDDFGRVSNDTLMYKVESLHETLDKREDAFGLVILYGPRITQYLNQRRIEGCSRWRKRPAGRFRFIFGPDEKLPADVQVKFCLVAKDTNIKIEPPDYKLSGLKKPVELSASLTTDEYCPRYFDLEWYSHFMSANPTFRGKVIIDASLSMFNNRVIEHRNALDKLGIGQKRLKFIRRHFVHERDEQWWLIPSKQ